MRKLIALLAACTILTAALIWQYAASKEENVTPHSLSTLRITAVIPHDDRAYWTNVSNGMLAAENDYDVDVKICIPSTNYSVPQMIELIYAAIAAHVDAIVVSGASDEAYIAALASAREQGIQVVFVDTDIEEFPEHLYVGTDNYAAGRFIGELLIDMSGGSAQIGIISGSPEFPNLELRAQGIRDAIADYPDMQIRAVEYAQFDPLTLIRKYELLSAPGMNIDTLVCVEGTGAMSMGGLLAARAPAFERVIAFDNSQESSASIVKGFVDGLVIQQEWDMGYRCIEEIYRFATQGSYSQITLHTGTEFITITDLNEEGTYEAH